MLDNRHQPIYAHFSKQRSSRAPCWSWASLDGPVGLTGWGEGPVESRSYKPFASLIAAGVCEASSTTDRYSVKGFLKLTAFLTQATLESLISLIATVH